jgi:hypothetical protein
VKNLKGYTIAAVLAIAAAFLAPPATAQSPHLSATIPFDFYVAGKLLPAGKYTVATLGNGDAIRIFAENGDSAYVLTSSYRENRLIDKSRLTFRRYGALSFLTGIYWSGYSKGRETVTTPKERNLAKTSGPPATTVIAGR